MPDKISRFDELAFDGTLPFSESPALSLVDVDGPLSVAASWWRGLFDVSAVIIRAQQEIALSTLNLQIDFLRSLGQPFQSIPTSGASASPPLPATGGAPKTLQRRAAPR